MRTLTIAILTAVVLSVALSSCAVFRSCHITANLNPPTISVGCDSLLNNLLTNGGTITFPKGTQTGLLKAGQKRGVDVKVKVNR